MASGRAAKLNIGVEEIVSYLPLSHVAAQILDIYIPILFAATVYFAQPDALKVRSLLAVCCLSKHCVMLVVVHLKRCLACEILASNPMTLYMQPATG